MQIRKKILTKIFRGTEWESKLVGFVGVFANKRQEFILALSIHTAVAFDEAIIGLRTMIDQGNADINQRYVPRKQVVRLATDNLD